jgi:hypothetical protein
VRALKSGFGLISALVPVAYCGYLLYYFLDLSESVEELETNGLGPTALGLGIVGLLFCIPLLVKVVRLFSGPRSPGSSRRGGPDGTAPEGEFDADAVVARYLARQRKEPTPDPFAASFTAAAATPAPKTNRPQNNRPAGPASFGRKIR